jgi:WD40 repeat protein
MAITAGGKTLATGTWDRITLWDMATGEELHTLKRHHRAVACVTFSPNATMLASGSLDLTIKLWDVATGKELRTLRGHTERVVALAFSPNGATLVSGSRGDTIKVWDVATGKELRTLTGLGGSRCLAFSSDGKTILLRRQGFPRNMVCPILLSNFMRMSDKKLATSPPPGACPVRCN